VNPKILALLALGAALDASAAAGPLDTAREQAINSFDNLFYHVDSDNNGYFFADTDRTVPDRSRFWQSSEEIEMVEDAYERTGAPVYLGMIGQLCNGLNNVVSGTPDWASWDPFNDDVMWACIAFARAYRDTGNLNFLWNAEYEFNEVWSRGYDSALGGGLWQTTWESSKNACVNGPAAIAGILLGRYTTGTGFMWQAQQAYNWELTHLFVPSTGRIADHQNADGSLDWGAWTYNQGTFIGASTLFYEATGDAAYPGVAGKAAVWAQQNLTGQHVPGILNDEYDSRGGNGDGPGFKGIFVRWCGRWLKDDTSSSVTSWLSRNATSAWIYRNKANVSWAQWWRPTPSGAYLTAWECSSSVAAQEDVP
jgi:predicted alpha-1,6-mannanase (GH76 family)